MVQNVRRGFNPHGVKKVFFYNLVKMYWALNSIYVQFEYLPMSQVEQCLCISFADIEGDVWILRTEGDA